MYSTAEVELYYGLFDDEYEYEFGREYGYDDRYDPELYTHEEWTRRILDEADEGEELPF